MRSVYAGSGLEAFLAGKPIIFVDSITDLTRQAMAFAKLQPEAVSERTGKADVRGAYGLLGGEVIQALKHLQHAPGKTVIFISVLEKVTDDFNVASWQLQMEGFKAGRELSGIGDQVISMQLIARDADSGYVLDEKASERRLVCRAGNPFGLPAKDRSSRVDGTVPMERGLLKASATSDARMLDCEFAILERPYARRKFWQNFTVAGGKVDEKDASKGWNITKVPFRAMIDTAPSGSTRTTSARQQSRSG